MSLFKENVEAWYALLALGICHGDLKVNKEHHIFVAECPIRFWWKEIPASEMFRRVYYIAVQDVVSAHPGLTNVETNAPRLSV